MPLFIPVSATKSAIRLRMRISEENKDSLAKSMNFNSIWLKNRLYNSQIELFSFDLAIEYLVDAFLFYPFAHSQYEIEAFGDNRGCIGLRIWLRWVTDIAASGYGYYCIGLRILLRKLTETYP